MMLRKKNSEPAQQPDAQQELLDFEDPAVQPGKKDPKQFLKRNWKKITAVVCVAAVAAAVLLPKNSKKAVQARKIGTHRVLPPWVCQSAAAWKSG